MTKVRSPGPTLSALVAVAVLAANVAAAVDSPPPGTTPFKVIVHPKVVGTAVPKSMLAGIYLGKVKRWGDGKPIAPVDLPSNSPLRAAFASGVLGMSLAGVRAHWMQRLAAGERPPLARPTEADVIAYVGAEQGAIGYVSQAATLPDTVKVLALE